MSYLFKDLPYKSVGQDPPKKGRILRIRVGLEQTLKPEPETALARRSPQLEAGL